MRFSLLLAALLVPAAALSQPRIAVDGGELSLDLTVGTTTSRALTVRNAGTAPLDLRVRTVRADAPAALYAIDAQTSTLYSLDPSTGATRSSVRVQVSGLLAFDGRVLYAVDGTVLHAIDPVTGEVTATVTLDSPSGSYYYYPYDVAVSDGRVLSVTQDGRGSQLDVFDAGTGRLVRSIPLAIEVRTVAAGDGRIYVSGRDPAAGSVLVTLDATTGERLRVIAFPALRSLSYSSALGAVVALDESGERVARLYDAVTGDFRSVVELPSAVGYSYYSSVAADEGREAAWLTVSPRSRTLVSGGEVGLTVAVDTRRLVGGTYRADLVLASNDPAQPTVTLPVTLTARGAPQLDVRPSALAFGAAYVGTPLTRDVEVVNTGSDTLRVGGVAVSDARLAVDASAFELLPGASRALSVTLTPTGAGALDAALTLTTNVSGSESVVVPVTAGDAFPPVLRVTPATLAVAGTAGAPTTGTVTISNDGQGPLAYSATVGLTGTVLPARPRAARSTQGGAPPEIAERVASQQARRTSAGVSAPSWSVLMTDEEETGPADLIAVRGATDADSLYLAFDFATLPDEIQVHLALDLDTDPNTGYESYGLGADAELGGYAYRDGYTGTRYGEARAYHYFTGQSYSGSSFAIEGNTFQIAVPLSVLPGADRAFDAFVNVYGNRVVNGYPQYGSDSAPDGGILFVQSAPWLQVDASGEVPAGGSRELAVELDATDLLGGVYTGRLMVDGNGPAAQRVILPVTFTVTGAPSVSAPALALGTVYVGYPSRATVDLRNDGTDVLVVSAVASSTSALVASLPRALQIRPGETASVPVAWTASATGDVSATLTFTTNTAAGTYAVAVSASAIEPPIAGLSVSSLNLDLAAGEATTATVTLQNTGASPLGYQARVVSALSTARSAGDTDGLGVGLALATARAEARTRTGQASSTAEPVAASTVQMAPLPTLLVDPDEGRVNDVVEVRGQAFPKAGVVTVELVFARPVQTGRLDGAVLFDTDRNASTGYQPYIDGTTRQIGVDLEVNFYGASWGQVYLSGSGVGQYIQATISDRSLRFNLPASFVPEAFDIVGYSLVDGSIDVFPDAGISSADARLGWLAMTPSEGSVAAGASSTLTIDVDATDLAAAQYEARIQITTTDPGRPVLSLPVSLAVRAGVAGEGDALAAAFALLPAAPNPAQGTTRLRYTLVEDAPVAVEVYDAVGRRVAALDEGPKAPGAHEVALDTRDLPTGVYVVRLYAGAQAATQRLSVIR